MSCMSCLQCTIHVVHDVVHVAIHVLLMSMPAIVSSLSMHDVIYTCSRYMYSRSILGLHSCLVPVAMDRIVVPHTPDTEAMTL